MQLRTKLTLILLAPAVGAVTISAWLEYRTARASLTGRVFLQLTSVRQDKKSQVEGYFQTAAAFAQTFSEDLLFSTAMKEFRDAVRVLDGPQPPAGIRAKVDSYYRDQYLPRLSRLMALRSEPGEYLPVGRAPYLMQDRYVVENPYPVGRRQELVDAGDGTAYSRVHAKYHPLYRRLLRRTGYADLYLIDHDSGRIVYSVLKEPAFGTSLKFGPYRNTGLARVFGLCAASTTPEAVFLVDFEPFEPSLGAPAMFICSPIIEQARCAGVFAFRLSTDEINRVLSGNRGWERDGLGLTGTTRVVGADFLMRSDSRRFTTDPNGYLEQVRSQGYSAKSLEKIRTYGTTVLQQEVRRPSVEAALQGREGTLTMNDFYGNDALVAYTPLRIPGLNWMIETRMDEDEALAPVKELRDRTLWLTLLVALGTLAVALLISRSIVRPVEALSSAALNMAAGDLASRVEVRTKDELGALASAFNLMADSIEFQTREIRTKNRENESLLLNILPGPIADRLKHGENLIADNFAEVTVLFADIVGFTVMSDGMPPKAVIDLLNGLFSRFDAIARDHGVEKIKTIGDAYMAVAGLPKQYPDHAARMADIALAMIAEAKRYSAELGTEIELRIGLNTGPVIAGVIGTSKFIYDLWGDTVNVASRMEAHGLPGAIQLTRSVYETLKADYEFEFRGPVEVKGKGRLETWLLLGPKAAVAAGISAT